ncbi:tRNA lysidine(34) synthetase TilS [Buchnera aphidicola (Hormaphis cornu)]|nr:tRNA lysidine(34) synthetase TilS [Buchnera aphidicola (Hormaphis cornu)]
MKIPPWQRERIPLLFYNNQFIAAIGYFITTKKLLTDNHYWNVTWKKNCLQ